MKKKFNVVNLLLLTLALNIITIGVMAYLDDNWLVLQVEAASRPDDRPAIYGNRVAWVEFDPIPPTSLDKETFNKETNFWITPPIEPLSLYNTWLFRPGSEPLFSYKVMVFDLDTGQLWDLRDDLPPCTFHLIDMYGDWVITEQRCSQETETIHGYNLQTQEYIKITPYEVGTKNIRPSIDENFVVWVHEDGCCDADIRMFDLDTQTTISLTNNGGYKIFPDKSGDWVVWSGGIGNDIYGLNLVTTEKITITNDPVLQWYPRIDDDIIVWTDQWNDFGDVYGYNLATRQEFIVSDGLGDQFSPAIHGSLVSWTEYRDETFYISALDMATGEYFTIHDHPPDTTIFEPSMVYGNRVVWRYDLNLESYLYTAQRLRFQNYLPIVLR